jgi:hypothetical protein
MKSQLTIHDVSRADQMAAALHAGDNRRVHQLIAEARAIGSVETMCLALGTALAHIASEFYQEDAQLILDMEAAESMAMAQAAKNEEDELG